MNKSKLFKMAHAIRNQFESFSEALRASWKAIKLRMAMKTRNVAFKFRKVDGSIREAVGTLNVSYEAKGTGKVNYGVVNYYDCAINQWRSFKVEGLL